MIWFGKFMGKLQNTSSKISSPSNELSQVSRWNFVSTLKLPVVMLILQRIWKICVKLNVYTSAFTFLKRYSNYKSKFPWWWEMGVSHNSRGKKILIEVKILTTSQKIEVQANKSKSKSCAAYFRRSRFIALGNDNKSWVKIKGVRSGIILLHDNAQHRVAGRILNLFASYGWEKLDHPPTC